MRIAACYKNVPDNEKIKLAPDNSLDLSAAAPQIGQYDLNAVEAALVLKEQTGAEVIVSVGRGIGKDVPTGIKLAEELAEATACQWIAPQDIEAFPLPAPHRKLADNCSLFDNPASGE